MQGCRTYSIFLIYLLILLIYTALIIDKFNKQSRVGATGRCFPPGVGARGDVLARETTYKITNDVDGGISSVSTGWTRASPQRRTEGPASSEIDCSCGGPVRQRLAHLVAHFVAWSAQDLKRPVPALDDGVVAHLQAHAWPGNVREFEHVIRRAVLLCKGGVVRVEDLALPSVALPAGEGERPPAESPTEAQPPTEAVDEKQQILAALQATHWRVSGVHGAAALLGMHPEKLRYRIQKYGLRRPKK